ncbi:DUF1573 domain-containing protein [Leadbetterella byssophila]|uniref:DUF1573 domain-containing protein n=1 Tax=Leadbetterella byssophila (strain DSM 17132 / JCM 16389 / KACC 11308 / NBRC 106382 / 4M15) TaxID=649349 RepID=E4RTV5_LEAB4|nr:DUF1573 domain-containing protein [Leadbetterella byssophila]ADQ18663.1 protein of unknown function DUF1573 [Leadbetterella byssophila DSM 17132]
MKKFLFTLVGVLFFAAASHAQGKLKFNKMVHDFGKVKEAGVITYNFEVTNVGNAPVVITNAQASCGCTTPEVPKEPIMPGQTKTIKVGYDTKGRVSAFNKTITVISNAENSQEVLTIKGEVLPKSKVSSK